MAVAAGFACFVLATADPAAVAAAAGARHPRDRRHPRRFGRAA
jgi:hypothetical protein